MSQQADCADNKELTDEDLIEYVRTQCMKNKVGGSIMGLSTVFRKIDRDHSKRLNLTEFKEGMTLFGIRLNERDMKRLFNKFDKDGSKTVDFNEFLRVLKPPMAPCRIKLVKYVFQLLDKDHNKVLTTDDIAQNGKFFIKFVKYIVAYHLFYVKTNNQACFHM